MSNKPFKASKVCCDKPKPKQATVITRTVSLAFKRVDDFEGWRHNDPSRKTDKAESGDSSPEVGSHCGTSQGVTGSSDTGETDGADEDDGTVRYIGKEYDDKEDEDEFQCISHDSDDDDDTVVVDVGDIHALLDMQPGDRPSSVASIHINCEILKIETQSLRESHKLMNLLHQAKPTSHPVKQQHKPATTVIVPKAHDRNLHYTTIYGGKTRYKKANVAMKQPKEPTPYLHRSRDTQQKQNLKTSDGKPNSAYAPAPKKPICNKNTGFQSQIKARQNQTKPKWCDNTTKLDYCNEKEYTTKAPPKLSECTVKRSVSRLPKINTITNPSKQKVPLANIQASISEHPEPDSSTENVSSNLTTTHNQEKPKAGWLKNKFRDLTTRQQTKIPQPNGKWSQFVSPRPSPCSPQHQQTSNLSKSGAAEKETYDASPTGHCNMDTETHLMTAETSDSSRVDAADDPELTPKEHARETTPADYKLDKKSNVHQLQKTHSHNRKYRTLQPHRESNTTSGQEPKSVYRQTLSPYKTHAKRKPPLPTFRKQKMPRTSRNCNIMPRLSITSICKKNRRRPRPPLWERVHTETPDDLPRWKRQQLLCLRATIEDGLTGKQANRIAKLATDVPAAGVTENEA